MENIECKIVPKKPDYFDDLLDIRDQLFEVYLETKNPKIEMIRDLITDKINNYFDYGRSLF